MNNTVPRRAEDVINTLIEAYNEDAIEDKRRVSIATGKFIKARLDVIGRELGDVDPQYRGHQEGQPDGGHHLGGRAQRVGKVRATRRKVFRSKTRSTWRSTSAPT